MTNWNDVMEEFANLVANKVIQKLKVEEFKAGAKASLGSTIPEQPYDVTQHEDGSIQFAQPKTSNSSEVLIDFGDNSAFTQPTLPKPALPKPAVSSKDKRLAELNKTDIRILRKKIARVENATPSDYSHLEKDKLAVVIWELEALMGRTLDEEIERLDNLPVPDDDDSTEAEPEDDNELGTLSREEAEALDLAPLKRYAVAQGVAEADLTGLDIEAVLDLLYGSTNPTEAPVASQEVSEPDDDTDGKSQELELDLDDIKKMSLGELRKLADDLNDQGAEIVYDRSTKPAELLEKILSVLEEVEE